MNEAGQVGYKPGARVRFAVRVSLRKLRDHGVEFRSPVRMIDPGRLLIFSPSHAISRDLLRGDRNGGSK